MEKASVLSFEGLSATVKDKTILKSVSGFIDVSRDNVTAIIGSSGAGKTTFLNTISGRAPNSRGVMTINGRPIASGFFTEYCGYPMASENAKKKHVHTILKQLDLIKCADTRVGNALIKGISGGQKRRVSIACQIVGKPSILFLDEPTTGLDSATSLSVVKLLKCLGTVSRSLTDLRSSSIAAPMRRDSISQDDVKGLLGDTDDENPGKIHEPADGVAVIASLHQPSSTIWSLIDQVILLKHGAILYAGPTNVILKYFARLGLKCPPFTNPAEYLLEMLPADARDSKDAELLTPGTEAYVVEAYKSTWYPMQQQQHTQSRDKRMTATNFLQPFPANFDAAAQKPGFRHQLTALFHRSWMTFSRLPMLLFAKVLQFLVLGLIVGITFLDLSHDQNSVQNRLGCFYFVIITQIFGGALSVVLVFADERAVFLAEQSTGLYDVLPYVLGKNLVDMFTFALGTFVSGCVLYPLVGFQPSFTHFINFQVIIILVAFCGQALGYLVGAAVSTVTSAALLAPLSIAPFILFTSYALPNGYAPAYYEPLRVLSPFYWAFDAMTINEFADLELHCLPGDIKLVPFDGGGWGDEMAGADSTGMLICRWTAGVHVLQTYHVDYDTTNPSYTVWTNIAMLAIVMLTFRLVSFGLFKYLSNQSKLQAIRTRPPSRHIYVPFSSMAY